MEIPQGTRDELVRAGLENRKDLQASRLFVNAAEKALKASWWQFAPSVIGQGQVLWANAAGFTGEETTWQVGITALGDG